MTPIFLRRPLSGQAQRTLRIGKVRYGGRLMPLFGVFGVADHADDLILIRLLRIARIEGQGLGERAFVAEEFAC
jgi:hypothetical protein